jgi:hypothetical protein
MKVAAPSGPSPGVTTDLERCDHRRMRPHSPGAHGGAVCGV